MAVKAKSSSGVRRRATIVQVARLAGAAPATVSAVLNGRSYCYASEETKKRVLRSAEQLGYRPNIFARALRGGASKCLALITSTIGAEVNNKKCEAFEAAATKKGFITFMSFNPDDPEREDRLIRASMDHFVDGIVIYPARQGSHMELRKLVADNFPVVTVNGADRLDFDVDDVSPDFELGGRLQARHLVEINRRRIGIIRPSRPDGTMQPRVTGVLEELAAAGCPSPNVLSLDYAGCLGSDIDEASYRQIHEFLAQKGRDIDGIIATNDILALSVIRAAINLRLHVPNNLAIVGFDGSSLARHAVIPLTTIAQPAQEVGAVAFDLLAGRIENRREPNEFKHCKLTPKLVVRASTMEGFVAQ